MTTWKNQASSILLKVFQEHWDKPEYELKKEILKAYPYGERAYFPYKIWCRQKKAMLKVWRNFPKIFKKQSKDE